MASTGVCLLVLGTVKRPAGLSTVARERAEMRMARSIFEKSVTKLCPGFQSSQDSTEEDRSFPPMMLEQLDINMQK